MLGKTVGREEFGKEKNLEGGKEEEARKGNIQIHGSTGKEQVQEKGGVRGIWGKAERREERSRGQRERKAGQVSCGHRGRGGRCSCRQTWVKVVNKQEGWGPTKTKRG